MKTRWIVVGLSLVLVGSLSGCGSRSDATASIPSGTPTVPASAKPAKGDWLHPKVAIEVSVGGQQGVIQLTLDREKTPLTVDNFLSYVDKGFYDQTIFHQVLKNYVILGGAFTSDFVEKPASFPVRNEAQRGLKNARGTIAMARRPDVIESATCQFFLNVADNPTLDHQGDTPATYGYCAFGQVTQGMEWVDRIAELEVKDVSVPGVGDFERTPVQTVTIRSIRVLP